MIDLIVIDGVGKGSGRRVRKGSVEVDDAVCPETSRPLIQFHAFDLQGSEGIAHHPG